jgi:hypothetical protein
MIGDVSPPLASRGTTRTPLEQFVCDYVETLGGAWDEVEPQVFDLLMPGADDHSTPSPRDAGGRDIVQITFDPEALPEHAHAQLASFGSPLIDGWIADAQRRGRSAECHVNGLNVSPHDLPGRLRRALPLAADTTLEIDRVRAQSFPQAVFWFQATFAGEHREQEIIPVAVDQHYGRQVRHLDQLLDGSRLGEQPAVDWAPARHGTRAAAYRVARDRALRTAAAMANTRSRELADLTERQVVRMRRYFADLREELAEQVARAVERKEDTAKFAGRHEALDLQERLRVAELRQKSALQLHLRLCNLLVVHQPKLLVLARLIRRPAVCATGAPANRRFGVAPIAPPPLEAAVPLVWDPLTESLEAPPCPACRHPTFELAVTRAGIAVCKTCLGSAPHLRE